MKKKNGFRVGRVLLIELLVLFIGLPLLVKFEGGDIVYFIDYPSLFIILLFFLPVMSVTGMWKDFFNAFRLSQKRFSISQLRRCLEAVSLAQKLILIAGLFSGFVSVINVLRLLVNASEVGPLMAVVVLSGFYTTILELFLISMKSAVQMTIIDEMELDTEEDEAGEPERKEKNDKKAKKKKRA